MNIVTFAEGLISPAPTAPATPHRGMSAFWFVVLTVIVVLEIIGLWRTFQKAGRPGWGAIVPIYNIYNIVKVAGRSGWWVILYFIPLVNIVVHIIVSLDVAKAFGKSDLFGIFGLWLFGFIGYPMLGYGDAKYQGTARP